jgi:hypothetical protein
LGWFQATKADKEDTRRLLQTINNAVTEDPILDENLDRVFNALWPDLEDILKKLPPADQAAPAKRTMEDMVAEILEFARAEANRRKVDDLDRLMRSAPAVPSEHGLEGAGLAAIKAKVYNQSNFLGSCLEHMSGWRLGDGEAVFLYAPKDSFFADLLKSREQQEKLRSVCAQVLGQPVRIRIQLDQAAEAE